MKEKRLTNESGRIRIKKDPIKKPEATFWNDRPDPIYFPKKKKKK
jgi:hypothetical protein